MCVGMMVVGDQEVVFFFLGPFFVSQVFDFFGFHDADICILVSVVVAEFLHVMLFIKILGRLLA